MKNIPERIFLKLGFEPEATDDFNDLNEVTWSTDGDADDIEYVLAASPDSYREALEKICNEYHQFESDELFGPVAYDIARAALGEKEVGG